MRGILKPGGLVCVAREPLAPEDEPPEGLAPVVYAAPVVHTIDSLKRLFTDRGFALVSEDVRDGRGTFWFRGEADS